MNGCAELINIVSLKAKVFDRQMFTRRKMTGGVAIEMPSLIARMCVGARKGEGEIDNGAKQIRN
jgi:hypothetical protein